MATTLTENEDDYPAASAMDVPVTGDRWGTASAVVRGIAQLALNRTAWLRKRAVQLTENNTLTGDNLFTKALVSRPHDTLTPLLRTDYTAEEHDSGNRWMLLFTFKSDGGMYVHVYSGSDGGGRGGFAITFNARWEPVPTGPFPNGHWTVENAGGAVASSALIWRHNDVRLVGKPAGSADWANWPQSSLSGFGSEFLSQIVRAHQFLLPSTVNRTTPIPVSSHSGGHFAWWDESDKRLKYRPDASPTSDEGAISWAVQLLPGATFKNITIRHEQQSDYGGSPPIGTGSRNTFKLWRRNTLTSGWDLVQTAPTEETVGIFSTQLWASDQSIIVDAQHEYRLTWHTPTASDIAAVNNNGVYGLELKWSTAGLLV